MNVLYGGAEGEEDNMIPVAFGFLVPLGLAVVCFLYAARTTNNSEAVKKLKIVLYVQGSIYLLILLLFAVSRFIDIQTFPYLILTQKIAILLLISISGYGISVYEKTDPSAKDIRNVVLGISIVGLLTGLPLIKAIPKCILDNIKTEIV